MASFIVGLTGGIASGKSEAEAIFNRLGIQSVDADIVARQIVAPGSDALKQICTHFGDSILNIDGSLNRTKLRNIVFNSAQQKTWLEQLTHPLIREHMLSQLLGINSSYGLLVAPLLFENNLQQYVSRSLVIDTNPSIQLKRTMARDRCSEQQAKAIIDSQMPREQRLRLADDVVDNSQTHSHLETQIEQLHLRYLALS
ncbi:dephospho-CoA kinase [Alginatibacterium sediminis]|uniref:Dephospho-CoA kinase n=1 Tax=Alginatibacterium sediminis TaxID=2164068 RepID=A0A420EJG9_9ALTE|nr:dephospho-CoA kinase [Alginatibacterium sediminis]RKF20862.1 dephospho-CoA kinase [Alginatibacterium sediminis]